MKRSVPPSHGFSLIELLIGLALGLILTVGLLRIFVSSKQGYSVQESSSRMQENMRYALDAIGREIRQADFWGGVKPEVIAKDDSIAAPGAACAESWHVDVATGIFGYEGAANEAALGIPDCTVATYGGGATDRSDVLVVRYANANRVTADLAGEDDDALFLRSVPGRSGFLFPASFGAQPAQMRIDPSRPDDTDIDGAFNYRVQSMVLSLGVFTPAEDAALPAASRRRLPSLYACSLEQGCQAGGGTPQPLVEGIEQMQFEYGLDLNDDAVADRYARAGDIAAADWARVISVKVGLVVRGDAIDGFTDTNTYALPGGFSYVPADDGASAVDERSFQRRVIVRDFQIRNRVRQ